MADQDLRAPATKDLMPIVGFKIAAFALGRHVYAFSAEADRWDVLELPEGTTAQPIVSYSTVVAQGGNLASVFTAKTGTWDTIDMGK